jgi:uncharacterized membrane protein
MNWFEIVVALSVLLCTLVAGFLFAFASVAMPGIQGLNDRDFLRAFRAMDGVIQRRQPLFLVVWAGSVVVLLIASVLGVWNLEGVDYLLLIAAAALYLLGVQLPTATINIPLNNWLQKQDLDSLTGLAISDARILFAGRWTKWNLIRTIFAALTSALLISLLLVL